MTMRAATMSMAAAAVSTARPRGLRALFSTLSRNSSVSSPQSTILCEFRAFDSESEEERWEEEIYKKWLVALWKRSEEKRACYACGNPQKIESLRPWTCRLIIHQLPKFNGVPGEDPNIFLAKFHDVCDTLKYKDDDVKSIKFWAFPYSLREDARSWFSTLEPGSSVSWDELQQVFLDKYMPKVDQFKKRIMQIQYEIKNLNELIVGTLHEGPQWQAAGASISAEEMNKELTQTMKVMQNNFTQFQNKQEAAIEKNDKEDKSEVANLELPPPST